MSKQYPKELRDRAVRLVVEQRGEYESGYEAIRSIAAKLGIGSAESLRKGVRQAEVDAGARSGVSSDESAELRRLRRENAELKRANEILKAGGCRTNLVATRVFSILGSRVAAGRIVAWPTTSFAQIVIS
jgi:transposase